MRRCKKERGITIKSFKYKALVISAVKRKLIKYRKDLQEVIFKLIKRNQWTREFCWRFLYWNQWNCKSYTVNFVATKYIAYKTNMAMYHFLYLPLLPWGIFSLEIKKYKNKKRKKGKRSIWRWSVAAEQIHKKPSRVVAISICYIYLCYIS